MTHPLPSFPYLQLGGGANVLEGWVNTDLESHFPGVVSVDFTKPFPFPDSCFEAVFCEHTVEHVSKEDARFMFTEVLRVLKPGGTFRVVTPSMENYARMVLDPQGYEATRYLSWFREWAKQPNATLADTVNAIFRLHGHVHVYARAEMEAILADIGFVGTRRFGAAQYGHRVFKGVDSHGKWIGEDINAIESFALETQKPPADGFMKRLRQKLCR